MSSAASHPTAAGSDLAAEVERLRTILDRVPSCLMRVATDGTLLAVSDAALSLLGARELRDVLDTNLVKRLDDESGATVWAEFVERVTAGGSGSAECDLTDLSGTRRAVIVLGMALPDHPDGKSSLLVNVRDISTARRLEISLREQEQLRRSVQEGLEYAGATLQQLRAELKEVKTEREQLHAVLDDEVGHRQQIASAFEQLTRALGAAVTAAAAVRQVIEKGKRT